MNIQSFILAFIAIVMMAIPAVAEAPQEVTLTVSSDGPSKEDAIKNALRSAIEQAFGAFVSANTTILNDELVKDEIVTVSNGSVKEYKEISSVQTDNGNHFVTLTATVSLPNLITYAKSHGSECEFAGNTFGMEMKLFELQKENERKALYNLTNQIEAMLPTIMKHELIIGEPKIPQLWNRENGGVSGLDYGTTKTYYPFGKDINDYGNVEREQMICLRYSLDLVGTNEVYAAKVDANAQAQMKPFLRENIESTIKNYYEIPMEIRWVNASHKSEDEISKEVENLIAKYEAKLDKKALKKFSSEKKPFTRFLGNDRQRLFHVTPREHMIDSLSTALRDKYNAGIPRILLNTLSGISIPAGQTDEYKKRGVEITRVGMQNGDCFYFRNSKEDIIKWIEDLSIRIEQQFNSFVIADNTGVKSDFFPQHIADKQRFEYRSFGNSSGPYGPNMIEDDVPLMMSSWNGEACIFGTGLFYNYVYVLYCRRPYPSLHRGITLMNIPDITVENHQSSSYEWDIKVYIPKEDIGKYSKFWIEPKSADVR